MAAARPGRFSEEQFRAVCRELDQPPPAARGPWSLTVDSMSVKIYRVYDERSGLYEYKIFGDIADCPPKLCVDFYMDLNFRKQWDNNIKALYERTYDGEKLIYMEMKYPFRLSRRDYVYTRECQEMDVDGRKIWVVLAQSVSVPQCPEKPGIVRVKSYKQRLAIESDGKTGSKFYMYYFLNPGGSTPSRLINWIAQSAVPAFLKDMRKALRNYSKST
ncbi:phosphatidylcholine transfer protein isoform X1 [Falco biarmicus]|uniref:phosphatidylcholine transfer protein isoform X1 n=2 Tax=Falco TaxID=8952 RepID=UPI001886995F|nr:phosphatidylcholine transfer protein isoform X1 [Falco rusticolus]XP_055582178.1 phosphatidylcholine transfer protein isoform X2 [Falco cherrug]XP_056195992.1 phosphatidylcholine transfer protein isoform X1 [Falco biarmicus]